MKRLFDILVSATMLAVLAPLFLLLYLLVRLFLGAPAFFRQRRIGLRGKEFDLVKFRTMTGARDPATGALLPDAARTTAFGRFLRATSLDELPELLNVLGGSMSLVGPRPLDAKARDRFSDAAFHRHDVLPGVTGWAQIHGRNAITWDRRNELDLWYVQHHSLLLDLRILLRTIWVVVGGAGIDARPGGTTASGKTAHPAPIAGIALPAAPHPDALRGHSANAPGRPIPFWRRVLVVAIHVAVDALLLLAAFYIAYQLRLDFRYHLSTRWPLFWPHARFTVGLPILSLALFGAYRSVWRYFGLLDIPRMLLAFTASGAGLALWRHLAGRAAPAYSVAILASLIGLWLAVGIRLIRRHLHERRGAHADARRTPRRHVLVLGTSARAVQVAKDTARGGDVVVGFLSSDPARVGLHLADAPVLGTFDQWASVCYEHRVDDILVALSDVSAPATADALADLNHRLQSPAPEAQAIRALLARLPDPDAP